MPKDILHRDVEVGDVFVYAVRCSTWVGMFVARLDSIESDPGFYNPYRHKYKVTVLDWPVGHTANDGNCYLRKTNLHTDYTWVLLKKAPVSDEELLGLSTNV